jgi:hypothetical protein
VKETDVNKWIGVQSVHYILASELSACKVVAIDRKLARMAGMDILLPIPISFGVNDPHCTTLHTVCSSSNQNTMMTNSTRRVKSGNRSTYDLTLAGLNGNGGKAVGVAMLLGMEMARNSVNSQNAR